jgi:predicted outer membrane repeat protein
MRTKVWLWAVLGVCAVALLHMLAIVSPASAQTGLEIIVNNSGDSNICSIGGTCTLRGAINFVNTYNNPYPNRPRIVFSQNFTIALESSLPDVDKPVEIDGKGSLLQPSPTVDGGLLQAFRIQDTDVALKNLKISKMKVRGNGGAFLIQNANVLLENVSFEQNRAEIDQISQSGQGGAIFADQDSTLTLRSTGTQHPHCVFYRNSAQIRGGAIHTEGKLIIDEKGCLFDRNQIDSAGQGGAIYLIDRSPLGNALGISSSTFFNNRAGTGGAIYVESLNDDTITKATRFSISNSTFAENAATTGGAGGGVLYQKHLPNAAGFRGSTELLHVTLHWNAVRETAPGVQDPNLGILHNASGTLKIENSILGDTYYTQRYPATGDYEYEELINTPLRPPACFTAPTPNALTTISEVTQKDNSCGPGITQDPMFSLAVGSPRSGLTWLNENGTIVVIQEPGAGARAYMDLQSGSPAINSA